MLTLGASPRGSIALYKAAKAEAFLSDRNFVLPDDVKAITEHVLSHRLILSPKGKTKFSDASLDLLLRTIFTDIIGMEKIAVRTFFYEFTFVTKSYENLVYDILAGGISHRHHLGDLLIIHWLERMLAEYCKYCIYESTEAVFVFLS